jgi:hypothetical protein
MPTNAPQLTRRRRWKFLDTQPKLAAASRTELSTMAVTAVVGTELSAMAVTAVVGTEPSTMAVTAVGVEFHALHSPAGYVVSMQAQLRAMYPMIEGKLGTAIAKMMYRAAGLILRAVRESIDVPIQALERQDRRISLLGLLALACGSHGGFVAESRFRIDADDVEMALEKLYTMCEDECVSPSSVKKAEWQWYRVWIRSSFPR